MDKLVLEVVGNPNAGKTEVRRHLVKNHGFEGVLISDLIRNFAVEHGIPLSHRKDFAGAYPQMTDELGEDYVANTIMDRPSNLICVDGNRVPKIDATLRRFGAKAIALWCPIETRYTRGLSRAYSLDSPSFVQFRKDEADEYTSADPNQHNTLTVMQMADYHIDASQPFEAVLSQVDEIVAELKQ